MTDICINASFAFSTCSYGRMRKCEREEKTYTGRENEAETRGDERERTEIGETGQKMEKMTVSACQTGDGAVGAE